MEDRENLNYFDKDILNWSNKDWQNLEEERFRKLFKGSAVKRTKFIGLKRNIDQN